MLNASKYSSVLNTPAGVAKVLAELVRAHSTRSSDWLPFRAGCAHDLHYLRPVELVGTLNVHHAVVFRFVVAVPTPKHFTAARGHQPTPAPVVPAARLTIIPVAIARLLHDHSLLRLRLHCRAARLPALFSYWLNELCRLLHLQAASSAAAGSMTARRARSRERPSPLGGDPLTMPHSNTRLYDTTTVCTARAGRKRNPSRDFLPGAIYPAESNSHRRSATGGMRNIPKMSTPNSLLIAEYSVHSTAVVLRDLRRLSGGHGTPRTTGESPSPPSCTA
eukprot:COSAG02_NODE_686_length_18484_cov_29.523851_12_plen_277_part_00